MECTDEIQLSDLNIKPHPAIDGDFAYQQMLANNPQSLDDELQLATARQKLWNAKSETRVSSSISFDYGINQYARKLSMAYRQPSQQQNAQITLSLPVFNWGINRNKRRIAENEYRQEIIRTEESKNNMKIYIFALSQNYNDAVVHLNLSKRAYQVAEETYHVMAQQFAMMRTTVSELVEMHRTLIDRKKSYDEALQNYINDYFELRSLTLYDFEKNEKIYMK